MRLGTMQDFLTLIRNLVDEKIAARDHVEICQVVSDDNGSGKYNIKLLSGEGTVIQDVVSSRKTSFKNGDYVYILKVQNNLSNSIIISGNLPTISRATQSKTIEELYNCYLQGTQLYILNAPTSQTGSILIIK